MSHDHGNHNADPESVPGSITNAQIARRGFVLASLGFLAACASESTSRMVARGGESSRMPSGLWTADGQLPPQKWAQPVAPIPPAVQPRTAPKGADVKPGDKPMIPPGGPIPPTYDGRVIPRSAWTRVCPNVSEMEPIGTVRKITIHHTGNPYKFTDTGVADVKEELNHVLNGEMGEGHKDIAYHYVIDPAGRVWAARDIKYLGKHVRDWKGVDNRTGNVGVMLLGNFELQRPTAAQIATTQKFVMDLQKKHRVPKQKSAGGVRSKEGGVFMHCELSPTECPGDNMKSQWEALVYPRLIAKF
jgi:hypothetical protein